MTNGVVTGFGSVVVDENEIEDAKASVVTENADGTFSNTVLQLGQRIKVDHDGTFFQQLHKQAREEKPLLKDDAAKMRFFMLKACTITGHNLTGYFKKWGLQADAVYSEIAALNLPAPSTDPSTLKD